MLRATRASGRREQRRRRTRSKKEGRQVSKRTGGCEYNYIQVRDAVRSGGCVCLGWSMTRSRGNPSPHMLQSSSAASTTSAQPPPRHHIVQTSRQDKTRQDTTRHDTTTRLITVPDRTYPHAHYPSIHTYQLASTQQDEEKEKPTRLKMKKSTHIHYYIKRST